jgi:hypothetical protein
MLRKFTTALAAGALLAGIGLAAGSSAQAAPTAGGYWANSCEAGRACIKLSGGRSGGGGPYWNVDGCGYHTINDHYYYGFAHGNAFDVIYADARWDRVEPWTSRPLDPNNLVTGINVLC